MSKSVSYAELEIGLHRHQGDQYEVELRFNNPKSEGATAPVRGEMAIDPQALLELQLRPKEYGDALALSLFGPKDVAVEYAKVKTAVESSDQFLRVKLFVGPSATELHALRWELLTDPDSKAPLATSEKILFSRFGSSSNWRNIRLRAKADLRALVAVSARGNLADYQLAAVDIAGEIERAREHLKGIQLTVAGQDAPLTLNRLIDGLRDNKIDILYLVCHGALTSKGPRLWLQDDTGKVAVTGGDELAQRISELAEPPRLVVLASCESAGSEQVSASNKLAAGELVTLAPRLAEAGVPAVLAMQGKISMETVKKAMPVFFAELLKDGQIDRALAVARGSVRERPDSWMPALFLRLKGGKIWYEPGFTDEAKELKTWDGICEMVHQGQFIPILGPELGESIFGSFRAVARQLADRYRYPMADSESTDLAKVVQYLTIRQKRAFAETEVQKQLARNVAGQTNDRPLNDLLDEAVAERKYDAGDPYRILAGLPAKVYINASPETTLLKMLRATGKTPEPLACPWRNTDSNHPVEPQAKRVITPDAQCPWVYHVFGAFGVKDSLVLSEDDFFDYTIAASAYKLMPNLVRGSLVQSTLLFLGFRLDDWSFRVLFRMIMRLEGAAKMQGYPHVGVQISPDEHSLADAGRAKEYLADYFGGVRVVGSPEPSIEVYWGSAADFLGELAKRLQASGGQKARAVAPGVADGWD